MPLQRHTHALSSALTAALLVPLCRAYVYFCLSLALVGMCFKFPMASLLRGRIVGTTSLQSVPSSVTAYLALHIVAFFILIFVVPGMVRRLQADDD
jgi:hypothetical protein